MTICTKEYIVDQMIREHDAADFAEKTAGKIEYGKYYFAPFGKPFAKVIIRKPYGAYTIISRKSVPKSVGMSAVSTELMNDKLNYYMNLSK